MTVEIRYKNSDVNNIILNVWELQDNAHGELVVKFHNHECMRIKEDEIEGVEVKL